MVKWKELSKIGSLEIKVYKGFLNYEKTRVTVMCSYNCYLKEVSRDSPAGTGMTLLPIPQRLKTKGDKINRKSQVPFKSTRSLKTFGLTNSFLIKHFNQNTELTV